MSKSKKISQPFPYRVDFLTFVKGLNFEGGLDRLIVVHKPWIDKKACK